MSAGIAHTSKFSISRFGVSTLILMWDESSFILALYIRANLFLKRCGMKVIVFGIFLSAIVSGFPECAASRRFATSHPQHRLRLHPASHLRPLLVQVVSSQEVIVLTLLSSPYCGTSRKLSRHTLWHFIISVPLFLTFLHFSHFPASPPRDTLHGTRSHSEHFS